MSAKREILYPFYLECIEFCEDNFWENIFENLAYGKPPQNTYISKNNLCCSYKNREFNYYIERKEPKVMYTEIYNLLTQKAKILSQRQKEQCKLDFEQMEEDIKESRKEWNSIRKKYIRDVLYERYVLDMKGKYNLSYKQCKWLLSIITIALLFKTLTSKDIIFKDNAITEIKGIQFQPGKILFNKSLFSEVENEEYESEEEEREEEKKLSELWDRYLHYLSNINKK